MGDSVPSELIVFLREANREIGGIVSGLSDKKVGTQIAVPSFNELQALARKLGRGAKVLHAISPAQSKDEAIPALISEYVCNLEKLKGVLSEVQRSLEERRARLMKDLEHMSSAQAWVEAMRSTSYIG